MLEVHLAALGLLPRHLVQWGATDNGDWLLWVPVGRLDAWPTIILEVRQRDLLLVPKTSTSVILDLLTGELTTRYFRKISQAVIRNLAETPTRHDAGTRVRYVDGVIVAVFQ